MRLPSISFGQVQPLGVRSTIIGQRGRSVKPFRRASALMRWISRDDRVQRGRHQLVHLRRVVPLDEIRRVAVAAEQLVQLLVADAGQDGRDWRSCSR